MSATYTLMLKIMFETRANPKFSCRFKWQEGKGEQELNLVFL